MRSRPDPPATRRIALRALVSLALAGCSTAGSPATAGPPAGPASALARVVAEGERQSVAALPAGDGKTTLEGGCLLCHGAAMIEQQRKDSAAWAKTVTLMRTWGAPVPADDVPMLLAYLTRHFGPVGR